jgi:hypothetical protein
MISQYFNYRLAWPFRSRPGCRVRVVLSWSIWLLLNENSLTVEPGSKNPEWRERGGDMNTVPRITEIDISKPAGALASLRLTDYGLVVLCGFSAIGLLSDLVVSFPSADAGTLVFELTASLILGFAAYTGWRHVGVIDPAVWRTYRVVFPLLVVFCLFVVCWPHPARRLTLWNRAFSERFQAVLIGGVALLGWISLIRLRRLNITAMGATVGQVLLRLAKNAGVTAVQATDIRRINKPRGLVLATAGALVLLAVIIAPMPNNDNLFLLTRYYNLMLLGFFLLVRARRYFQIDADSLLAADRRSPILFLRSFDDDEKQTYGGSDTAFLDFSLETRLSNHFSRFGPFVAIGSPKEKVPQLGAARVLLSDDKWQPRVLSWMRDARLIIMYSGTTHWVNWELRQVVKNECATRLILMMPEIKALRNSKRNKEISARVEQVREVFKGTPWEEELLCFNDFARLRAMLFRPDGSMVMVKSRSDSRDSYHLAALVAHHILIESDALNDEDEDVRKPHEIGAGTDRPPPQPVPQRVKPPL